MFYLVFSLLMLLPLAAFAQEKNVENGRIVELFNFDWKFHRGNADCAQSVDYDDSNWRRVDLPHDFQIEQPWDQAAGGGRGYKAMGEGWYRKSFKPDPAWKGKRVLLDFEGVMVYGDVWLNGEKIASIDYGYLGGEADIAKHLNFDGDNVVAVHASTGKPGGSRWYTGGGIFRDVHLIIKDEISIARHGVYITTPMVSEQSADVRIQVDLNGITNGQNEVQIQARIISPDGTQVAETKTPAPKGIRLHRVEVPLPTLSIASPQLWSCETPNLYSAEVSIVHNGKVIDQVRETFGIRAIEFSKEFGFKLNGRKVFLKGIAIHHDLGALGAAVHDRAIERLFKQLKAFGFNHVRTSHNPYSSSFLKLADRYGILLVDELCDKWSEDPYWPGQKPFSQLWYRIVPEWIQRDRNHPSVILWSLGNELQMREDLAGFPTGDWGITTYRILDVLVKRYDSTRKTTVAMFPSRANAITRHDPDFETNVVPPELSLVTEVASFNYRFNDYSKYLQHAPHLIIYQSEASTSEMTGAFFGMDYDRMVGLAYWGAVEYWGESSGWPRKGWAYSFFNHALEPFPQAYLVKSAFIDEPMVRIGVVDSAEEKVEWNDVLVGRTPVSSHWNRAKGSTQNVFTYTNAEEVELRVNGTSIGVQKNPVDDFHRRNIIFWKNVPFGEGGEITAVARSIGKEVARHSIETTGEAAALRMEAETSDSWQADGMDLQYLKVRAVDEQGRVVPTFEGEVTFEVSGAATLRAVDNGDHATDEIFTSNRVKLHNGFAMAILRSTRTPGEVAVRVAAKGLRLAEMSLKTR